MKVPVVRSLELVDESCARRDPKLPGLFSVFHDEGRAAMRRMEVHTRHEIPRSPVRRSVGWLGASMFRNSQRISFAEKTWCDKVYPT